MKRMFFKRIVFFSEKRYPISAFQTARAYSSANSTDLPEGNASRRFKSTQSHMRDDSTRGSHVYRDNPTQEWPLFRDTVPALKHVQTDDDVTRYGESPRISLLMELTDRVGILHDVLRHFWKFDINICRIESRPAVTKGLQRRFDFYVDLEGSASDANFEQLVEALSPVTDKLLILDEKQVSWFPRHVSELDLVANRVLDAGAYADHHPVVHDVCKELTVFSNQARTLSLIILVFMTLRTGLVGLSLLCMLSSIPSRNQFPIFSIMPTKRQFGVPSGTK